jgi:cell division septum initiation protein DivIVA
MTDHTSARADEILTDLVELVETARTLPMSSACVVPRERTLDLLDALREVLPPEIDESRRLVAQRDQLIEEATDRAAELVRSATEQAESLTGAARAEAHNLLEEARAEQALLVSAATVHQSATSEAARIRAEADTHAELSRGHAEDYAEKLMADAHRYADATLSELIENLQRMAATAENGRVALARTRSQDE